MSHLVQGFVSQNDTKLNVLGLNGKYSYSFTSSEEDLSKQQVPSVPVMIMDFSWSMQNSNSAKPALDSVKETCKKLFSEGFEKVYLIFFGKTAYFMKVEQSNYSTSIDSKMNNYFNSSFFFETDGCFNPTGTIPQLAFQLFFSEIKNNPEPKYNVIFMTDGEFNGTKNNQHEWKYLIDNYLSKINSDFEFHTIGYQGDYLKNIIDMKSEFDKTSSIYNYYTISSHTEIEKKMKEITDTFESFKVQKLTLPNGQVLLEGEIYFSNTFLFENITPINNINLENLGKGITKEWLLQVLDLTLELGLKEQNVTDRMKESINNKNAKILYQEIVKELAIYYNNLPQKYLGLKKGVSSLKSRNVTCWKLLTERVQSFCSKFKEVQELVSNELNDKKQFEIATHIANSVKSRHLRTLQRRRINNEANVKHTGDFTIDIESFDPLVLVKTYGDQTLKITMDSKQEQLDEYYTCFYTQDEWSCMLNSLFGIPIKYSWKEGDDWTPSRANIENVSVAGYISHEGYSDVQELFGAKNSDHTTLYKNEAYIKSAHDGTNAYVPIATDPFFLSKISIVKERLGHMIAGSNLAFASRHILLYVAVVKQIINSLIDNQMSEKLSHTLLLVLNTFRLLTTKLNTVFNKDQTSASKADILLNIANGNTATYLFNGPYDCAVFALIAHSNDYETARNTFNSQNNKNLDQLQFKSLVWKMIYRHFLIVRYEHEAKFEDPLEWGLSSQQDVKIKLEEHLKTKSYEDAVLEINKDMMTVDKLYNLPESLQNFVNKNHESRMTRVFMEFVKLADSINDETWDKFNKFFLPIELVCNNNIRTTLIDQELKDLVFYTYWDCCVYGQKECVPLKQYDDLKKHIVNKINNNYGEQLRSVLGDAYELVEFRKRRYETRALPVNFTTGMELQVNELFGDVFNNKLDEHQFKQQMRSILGEYACYYFDDALNKDNIDVLKNLYEYCKTRVHTITIKLTALPFSSPANPTSPIFLQKLTDIEFSAYYRPIGFGYKGKKYSDWANDLHPKMVENLHQKEDDFVRIILEYVGSCKPFSIEKYEPYVKSFYRSFTSNNSINSQSKVKLNSH